MDQNGRGLNERNEKMLKFLMMQMAKNWSYSHLVTLSSSETLFRMLKKDPDSPRRPEAISEPLIIRLIKSFQTGLVHYW